MTSSKKLTEHIFYGILAGLAVGFVLKQFAPHDWVHSNLTDGLFDFGGTLFINAMKMLVIPLVFVSLVCGVSELSSPAALGRIGVRVLILYLATTAIAISIALFLASFFHIGQGANMVVTETIHHAKPQPLKVVLLEMFPTNPIKAMSDGKILQVIVFAILMGLALSLAGKKSILVKQFFGQLNHVVMGLVTILMWLAPYGVFCLLARLMLVLPLNKIMNILDYFLVVILALLVHVILTNSIFLSLLGRLNPLTFFKKMMDVMLFAFSTSSSNATLPISLKTVEEKMGVPNRLASFAIPFGATINMDGTAIMQGVATIFIANLYNIHLTLSALLSVVLTATLSSIGTAGIPSVGLVTLVLVLQQAGLPTEGIAVIIGVDRLLDMIRTAVNVTGDCMVCCVVARLTGEMDLEAYNKNIDNQIAISQDR